MSDTCCSNAHINRYRCCRRDFVEQATLLEKRHRCQFIRVLGVDGMYPWRIEENPWRSLRLIWGIDSQLSLGKLTQGTPRQSDAGWNPW